MTMQFLCRRLNDWFHARSTHKRSLLATAGQLTKLGKPWLQLLETTVPTRIVSMRWVGGVGVIYYSSLSAKNKRFKFLNFISYLAMTELMANVQPPEIFHRFS